MLLDDLIKEYVYEIQVRNYSQRTIKTYKNNACKFSQFIKNEFNILELEEVLPPHIKQYLNSLNKKGRSPLYINNILKNLRSVFQYGQDEGYCLNIAKNVKWLKEDKVVISTFNDTEVKKMLEHYRYNSYMDVRNRCIIAMLFDTGIRNMELCSIKTMDVKETVIYIMGKGRKERVVPISPYLKKIMIKYERIRNTYLKDDILHYDNYFLSFRNKPLTIEAIERVVKLAGESANVRKEIRCSPHTCRHYFAQSQLRNGLDIYSLSRLLGHESFVITKRYLEGLKTDEVLELSVKTSPLMNLRSK
ncbi:tyrosine-type recombinase/integrase [Clostridioides difficile]|uniref:tyrosine-type recombinase/integrase n=1 Tax=Clostridioides difficile TaxID=1496 RepID=UPI001C17FCAC|nr:tyrosine-type recombinase/integrase [Clostridioides difficile]HBF6291361.1 tyrosine-type recombinase/integrase [Clostridioides difficile]HBY2690089.1 tyrosine-type recombinase/integrase [Clostridioides difficile]HDO9121441.1 tyrosine-type recombinase/integrase [Clostridioides difficile]HDO9645980.1 tyrosine-type recombinase/integrase [Clostridioides difficile]